jgi:hypothetical protein
MIRPAQILALSLLTLGASLLHGVTTPRSGSPAAAHPADGSRAAGQAVATAGVRERAPRMRAESRMRSADVAGAAP